MELWHRGEGVATCAEPRASFPFLEQLRLANFQFGFRWRMPQSNGVGRNPSFPKISPRIRTRNLSQSNDIPDKSRSAPTLILSLSHLGNAIAPLSDDSEFVLALGNGSQFLGPRGQRPRALAAARSHESSNHPRHLPPWFHHHCFHIPGSIGSLRSHSHSLPDCSGYPSCRANAKAFTARAQTGTHIESTRIRGAFLQNKIHPPKHRSLWSKPGRHAPNARSPKSLLVV